MENSNAVLHRKPMSLTKHKPERRSKKFRLHWMVWRSKTAEA
jgi:hypothetical protein